MRILIEPGTHSILNLGDAAMLQVAVSRLRALWPQAAIQVTTIAPDELARICPGTDPVPACPFTAWWTSSWLPSSVTARMPRRSRPAMSLFQHRLAVSVPSLQRAFTAFRLRSNRRRQLDVQTLLAALDKADLVVACGMGSLTDALESNAVRVLEILWAGIGRGKPAVALGQGLGPMRQGSNVERFARHVLPRASLLALREGFRGPALAASLGVSPARLCVTGDDTIEMAYRLRPRSLASAVGVGLRTTVYSQITPALIPAIRAGILGAVERLHAEALPILISLNQHDGDQHAIQVMLGQPPSIVPSTPQQVIAETGRCRVVVTGAYHAAVFALSQGIPVVALANSQYYVDKFAGLKHQFGAGCEILPLGDLADPESAVASAILSAYEQADALRSTLLLAAERQIEAGLAAYDRVKTLV